MHEHKCYICLGSSATHNCYSCPKEVFNSDKTFVSFCSICSERLHGFRKDHQVKDIPTNATGTNDVLRMSLVSVICIETSHYVCYTRSGNQWLFHDSMADRLCKFAITIIIVYPYLELESCTYTFLYIVFH